MQIRNTLIALTLTVCAGLALAQDTVVYHITDATAQALAGLRNVKNHLDTDPKAKITVVSNGDGIDFMLQDAQDRNGNPFEIAVQQLVGRGVKFEVCELTLRNRSLKKEQFIAEATFTPSGVVQVTRLQHQGYAYLKP